jgi:hypothetical protein
MEKSTGAGGILVAGLPLDEVGWCDTNSWSPLLYSSEFLEPTILSNDLRRFSPLEKPPPTAGGRLGSPPFWHPRHSRAKFTKNISLQFRMNWYPTRDQ